jgi:hypothetical protein
MANRRHQLAVLTSLLRHGSKQAILTVFIISNALFLSGAYAQTVSVIPANLATAHIGEYATVEGVVAKVFTSKNGNTFLNMGASYPKPDFHWLDSEFFARERLRCAGRDRRKARQNHWSDRDVQRQAGNSEGRLLTRSSFRLHAKRERFCPDRIVLDIDDILSTLSRTFNIREHVLISDPERP